MMNFNKISSLFEFVLIILCFFQYSCTTENNYTNEVGSKTIRVKMEVETPSYTNVETRAGGTSWNNGDQIYILSNAVNGYVKYNNGVWTLTYTGNVEKETTCVLRHVTNPISQDSSSADLDYSSAVYEGEGTLNKQGDEVTLRGTLKPICSRIRFHRSDNELPIKISGVSVPKTYDAVKGIFQTEVMKETELSVSNGFTPYVYIVKSNAIQILTIKASGCIFTRNISDEQLANGASGYFEIPTKENPNSWTYVSEIPIEPWDGNVATSFAGGSGTFSDPYLIENGGQLALIRDSSGSYFKQIADIDLDNNVWAPVSLSGTYDGDGHAIKNLRVVKQGEKLGLFGSIGREGSVKNLTLDGIQVGNSNSNYVGGLAGQNEGLISNCSVIFKDDSYIKGNRSVGGMAGAIYATSNYDAECHLTDCNVTSSTSDFSITGNECVGGIAGSVGIQNIISNCIVNVNITGSKEIGGIAGEIKRSTKIEKCKYAGRITAENKVGGIVGQGENSGSSLYSMILSCCADATISVQKDYAGGIQGGSYSTEGGRIIACYSSGTITTASSNSIYVGGIAGDANGIYCCYSTVTSNFEKFCGILGDKSGALAEDCVTTCSRFVYVYRANNRNCLALAQDNDIIDHFKSSGSEYLTNWNFNNTWTWSGNVEGKTISVTCPKLSWEK